MNLAQAHRLLNGLGHKYPVQVASIVTESDCEEFAASIPNGAEFKQATHVFAAAQRSGLLGKVQSKCFEIAEMNPPGDVDSEDFNVLFDTAYELVMEAECNT